MNYSIILISENSFGISEVGDIANSIMALLTLGLAYYIFIHQKKKDKKEKKINWFKDIVVLPKIKEPLIFFDSVRDIKEKIHSNDLTETEKIEIIDFIKGKQSTLRKSFLELISCINESLYDYLQELLDDLTDHLTNVISNDELKLKNEITYEREICSKINDSYNKFFSKIFNFDG